MSQLETISNTMSDAQRVMRQATEEILRLRGVNDELVAALRMLMCWKMRDGSPCCCPAGRDEDELKGKMPTIHATNCADARAALAKVETQ